MTTLAQLSVHDRLSKHILADGFPLVMDMEASHGSYLVTKEGDSYLDLFTMFASSAIGYNHPYVVAREEFLGKMATTKPAMSDIYTEEYADFLDTFERVAMPNYLQYAFFVDGGTLAVENALKASFDWKTRLNFSKGIQKEAGQVIHFKQAFHGRSGYTLSLTNTSDPRKHMYFPKFNWPRIINPKLTFPQNEASINETIQQEEKAIAEILHALKQFPNEIACIILEPIQGEGGDNHFRPAFFKELRKICDEHEILLIFDEVQTGLGMTGKMWAHQHFDVQPDLIAFGKKTQVCGMLANKEKLDLVPNNVFHESSRINSTWGGNLIDMLRCKLVLEVIEKEKLIENAANMGTYLLEQLQQLPQEKVSNCRGRGLFIAFDMPSPKARDTFMKNTFNEHLMLLTSGEKSVRFRPPLNISKSEIDEAMIIIRESL